MCRKLLKDVPGTKGAPMGWWKTLHRKLTTRMGWTVSRLDPSYFWYRHNGELLGMLPVHVDDGWGGGTPEFLSFFKEVLEEETELGTCLIGETETDFIGMHLQETEDGLYLDQDLYIELKVKEMPLDEKRSKQPWLPATDDELELYRAALGCYSWVQLTRPEVAREASELAAVFHNLTIFDCLQLNKAVRILKEETAKPEHKLFLPRLPDVPLKTVALVDAGLGDRTIGARCIGLMERDLPRGAGGPFAPVDVRAGRIHRVAHSPFDAETLIAVEGADAGLSVAMFVDEAERGPQPSMWDRKCAALDGVDLGPRTCEVPLELHSDSMGMITKVRANRVDPNMCKRRRLDIADLKELVDMGLMRDPVHHVGVTNPIDALTKDRKHTTKTMPLLLKLLRTGWYKPDTGQGKDVLWADTGNYNLCECKCCKARVQKESK